jgi:sugar phosphate isomerase/epimerase
MPTMQEPMSAYFHVGIIHPMAFPEVVKGEGPVLETLRKICEDEFFQAVEVTRINDPKVRTAARAMLEQSGMEVIFAGQPPLLGGKFNINSPNEAARKEAVAQCKASVDQAYELGAEIMALLSGPDPGKEKREAETELLVNSLKQICAYAQEKAAEKMLSISLETFDYEIDKKCLIGPTARAGKVAAAVKAEYSNFGLTVDLSHQPLLGETISEMVMTAIDHLIHLHIGNCVVKDKAHPAYGDLHPRFGIAGGENGVEQVRQFLEACIYAGFFRKNCPTAMPVVSFEVKPLPGESSELIIANAKRTLIEAWAKL